MFGIGMPEMILILAVALIVIGPKKLPDLARSLGKAMGEFKKATSELKDSIQIDTEFKEVKSAFNDHNRAAEKNAPSADDGGDAHQPEPSRKSETVPDETDATMDRAEPSTVAENTSPAAPANSDLEAHKDS
ncbi:Sec-independent protein translocase protein TatA [Desulfosarcina ovata subsp. sediminis]|uniref:Sec-independent protein translocase protein TatA n=1 Tax=Desulfosarcina ovata subsp. sediminis TaxID=885957 RepID=A0A5K7ZTK1_9BACT|nr:Sec-independent protein translocase protein TatB [Desulfosarcina ovata]BBO83535.1 Sec-independent protein translocase protein TatA [Desulfosarcina ovata subsp. sediminis]